MDIVPAIPIVQEHLPAVTRQAMRHPHIMQDLFVVPKTGTFDQSQNDAAFRLSFSSREIDLFLVMPAALKQGYMLTKVLIHDCITIDDIPSALCSYNLKTAAFECFKSETHNWEDLVKEVHKTGTTYAKSHEITDVVRYAQNILQEVKRSIVQRHQDSFFLQGCDLMVHSIDGRDYRQILYVKYCVAVLSNADEAAWQQLVECVAEQLHESKYINKNCFVYEIETLLGMGLKSNTNSFLKEMMQLGEVEGVRMMLEMHESAKGVLESCYRLQDNTTTEVLKFLEDNIKGNLIMHLCVTRIFLFEFIWNILCLLKHMHSHRVGK